jgi:hypothetical protein
MSKPTTTETTSQSADAGTTSNAAGTSQAAGPSAKAKAPWELPFAAPFAMPVPEIFAQMMHDQIVRTQSIMNELAVYEGVAVQRARTAVDDLARLANDSIGYVGTLANEWRRLSIETMQRTADAFAPRA